MSWMGFVVDAFLIYTSAIGTLCAIVFLFMFVGWIDLDIYLNNCHVFGGLP